VVTLLTRPLVAGRNINFQASKADPVEWHDCDKDMLDGVETELGIKFLHLPVVDGQPPNPQTMRRFLKEAKEMLDSGKAVGVHCWQGLGRTAVMLAGYLIAHEGLSPKEAIKEVKQSQTSQESRYRILNSPYQRAYLENPAFPDNPGWKEPEVFIPPLTDPCFGSSEGGTKTEPLKPC
jgi:protein-tyrosine phosphatase